MYDVVIFFGGFFVGYFTRPTVDSFVERWAGCIRKRKR